MRLADVVGNRSMVALLRRLLAEGRLAHALLIEGPAGVGRRTLALALAQAQLCEAPESGDACGRCQSCRLVSEGAHPDLVQLPDARAKADIPVALVREDIVQPAQESALMGRGRAFIIPDVERLRGPSANALLKVLEEPPAGTRFYLTTSRGDGLLDTIRSRAQLFRLQLLSEAEVASLLQRHGVAAEEAVRRALVAHGSHRGLWDQQVDPLPLDELCELLDEGYEPQLIAELMERLPQRSEQIPAGSTLGAEQRRIVASWLEGLLQQLRQRLRTGEPATVAGQVAKVLKARGDLQRYIQPRLVVEALGL